MPEPIDTAGQGAATATPDNGAAATAAGDQNTVTKEGEGEGVKTPEGDGTKEGEDTETKEEDDEPQVRTRKSAKDFIIERQQRKIEKLRTKEKDDTKDDSPDGDEDDEIDPADEKVIKRVLEREGYVKADSLEPVLQEHVDKEDEREITDFLSNPDNELFKPYESKVRKLMKHESRRMLPIDSLFYEAAGRDLLRIGAQMAQQADDTAAEGQSGGGTSRGTATAKPDWAGMSTEEFRKEKDKVLGRA